MPQPPNWVPPSANNYLHDWLVPTASILGATLVAIGNYAVQRWRYWSDRLGVAVDQFATEINNAADLGTTYWLLDLSNPADQQQGHKLEPILIGRQNRLQQLYLALGVQDRHFDRTAIRVSLVDFYETLTGGNFQVAGRHPDPPRAREIQAIAARLNGELRGALARRRRSWV